MSKNGIFSFFLYLSKYHSSCLIIEFNIASIQGTMITWPISSFYSRVHWREMILHLGVYILTLIYETSFLLRIEWGAWGSCRGSDKSCSFTTLKWLSWNSLGTHFMRGFLLEGGDQVKLTINQCPESKWMDGLLNHDQIWDNKCHSHCLGSIAPIQSDCLLIRRMTGTTHTTPSSVGSILGEDTEPCIASERLINGVLCLSIWPYPQRLCHTGARKLSLLNWLSVDIVVQCRINV